MADPATSYSISTTQLPDWWTNYTQGVINTANQVASQPYAPYQGPTVAPLTDLQKQGMKAAGALPTGSAAPYGAASNALGVAAGTDISGAGAPGIQEGMQLARQASGVSAAGSALPYITGATNLSSISAAQPYVTGSLGALGQATNINVPGAAQPYINAAGQLVSQSAGSAVPGIAQYMDPFTNSVVNRVGQLAGRNLQENLLPRIGAQFIGAGQVGSDRAREMAARAIRDTQESALAQQSQLLSQGYGQALSAAQADLARQGQLAGTTGQLGQILGGLTSDQQRAILQSAQQQGALGQLMGNLTTAQQNTLLQAGQTMGQLTGADATRALQAAQELRTSGGALGQLAESQAAAQRAAASGYTNLAQQQQAADLAALKAQMETGNVGQLQTQANLDAARKAFEEEKNYPQTTLNTLISNIQRLAPPGTSYSATSSTPQAPSTAQNIMGVLGALNLAGKYNSGSGGQPQYPTLPAPLNPDQIQI